MTDMTVAGKTGHEDRRPQGERGPGKGGILKHKGDQHPPSEALAPAGRVMDVASVVHRAAGVQVVKRSRVSYPGATISNVVYDVEFEGHPLIAFSRMGEAVERAKAGPPEPVEVVTPSAAADEKPVDTTPE